jgi:hypothetical protein
MNFSLQICNLPVDYDRRRVDVKQAQIGLECIGIQSNGCKKKEKNSTCGHTSATFLRISNEYPTLRLKPKSLNGGYSFSLLH